MKKIRKQKERKVSVYFYGLLLILIMSVVVLLAFKNSIINSNVFGAKAIYDSDTKKATFNLKKGWSTMPIISGNNFGNNCDIFGGKEFIGVMWIWSPTQKKYYHIEEASESQEFKNDFDNKYYYTAYGGLWVYLTKDCDIWINDYSELGPDNFKIVQGWQFVSKHPVIAKKGFDIFKNCDIEKFNQWDNNAQKWLYEQSITSLDELKNKFDQAEMGEVFFIKFTNECNLDLGVGNLLPQPPALE